MVGRVANHPEYLKPNPWSVLEVAKKMECEANEIIFVGDAPRDYECAKVVPCDFIGIAYSDIKKLKLQALTPAIDVIVKDYKELINILR